MSELAIKPYKSTSMLEIVYLGGGTVPAVLTGTFTKESVAQAAIDAYLEEKAKQPEKADYSMNLSALEKLDMITKKDHLLEFAEAQSIEVPESMKQPATIKRYLKDQLTSD